MAKTFTYKMKSLDGQTLSGLIIAENERSVAAHIREKGYYTVEIKEKKPSFSEMCLLLFYRLSAKEIAIFCRQFSTMVDAGITITESLRVLIEQTENPALKKVLNNVYLNVQQGKGLSVSLGAHPEVFPAFMVNMLAAAEEAGTLDVVMERLAVHFEKEYKLNQKIQAALAYPTAVTILAVLSVSFILVFVLPPFAAVFETMNAALPPVTLVLLKAGGFSREYGFYLVLPVLFFCCLAKFLTKYPQVQKLKETFMFYLPILGNLRKKAAIARFSRTLATLLGSGVQIDRSLEIVGKIFEHFTMADILRQARTSIIGGKGLAAALAQKAFFPPLAVQMIAVGEKTGELEKMLEKIADFYDSEVDDTLTVFSSLLEPVLVGVLGIIIGLIVIAVMLPIFEMAALIK